MSQREDRHKCLICGRPVLRPGHSLAPAQARRALAVLTGLGFTRKELLTKHRAQLAYQTPGFVKWLEAGGSVR
jgi:hypothetical protein